jgi:hypothetical protein
MKRKMKYSTGIILGVLILLSSIGFVRSQEPAHIIQVDTGTEYNATYGQNVMMNFTLKTFSPSSASIELYGDQIRDWVASLSSSSLSVTAGEDMPITLTLEVPSGIVEGTYGMILQGLDGSTVIWRVALFVHVNEKKLLLDHPRVNHDGWISGENFPRELHLPYLEDVPVTIWITYQNDTWYNLYVDVDVYRDGVFQFNKIADWTVQTSEPIATGVEGWVTFPIGESRQYTSATYTYVIYIKNQQSGTSHDGTIESLTVTCQSFCPGAYPPLDTLSLSISSGSSSSSGSYSSYGSLQVSQEDFDELKARVETLEEKLESLNLTLSILIETLHRLNETYTLSSSSLQAELRGSVKAIQEEIAQTSSDLNSTLVVLKASDLVLSSKLKEISQILGEAITSIKDITSITDTLSGTVSTQEQAILILSQKLNYGLGLTVILILSNLVSVILFFRMRKEMKRK